MRKLDRLIGLSPEDTQLYPRASLGLLALAILLVAGQLTYALFALPDLTHVLGRLVGSLVWWVIVIVAARGTLSMRKARWRR